MSKACQPESRCPSHDIRHPGPPLPPGRESARRNDPGGQCGLAYFYEKNKADLWAKEGLEPSMAIRMARELYRCVRRPARLSWNGAMGPGVGGNPRSEVGSK